MPLSATVSGALGVLVFAMLYVELSAPALFGVKVNVTLQVELAATAPLQLSAAVKSFASVSMPVLREMALPVEFVITETALEEVVPTTVAVNGCTLGAMERLPPVPVPLRWMTCVAPVTLSALSMSVSVPEMLPATAGVKLML